jgi:hypothetical protein
MEPSKFSHLKEKIEKELLPLYPDMHVFVTDNSQTLSEVNYVYNGEKAYAGMVEGKIAVHWGKFYDRLAGNGWMYGNDWLFKFDSKDGSCKYDNYPENVDKAVELFIEKMKKNEN